MKCPKCDGEMENKGTMHSGNSLYDVNKCANCGHEEMKCQGLA